jgi:hypothetical protein
MLRKGHEGFALKKGFRHIWAVMVISVVHFAACRLLVLATMSYDLANTGGGPDLPLFVRLLVGTTRVLYFPVISLSLYSRHLFPGNWILIPMAVNSLLWGLAIYLIYLIWKKMIAGKRP